MSISEAATAASTQIQDQLNSQAEALLGAIGEAKSEVEETMTDLDSQWEQLNSKGEELITKAQAAEDQLQQMGDELATRAMEVREHVASAIDQGTSLSDATQTVVENLEQGVAALIPDIDDISAAVEATFVAFGEEANALDAALEDVRAAADQHIHDPFASLVEEVQTQLFDRGTALGTYVESEFVPSLVAQVGDLTSHVDTIVGQAGDKLEEVRSTAESEGSNVLDQVGSMFGDTFGSLIQTVETVANMFEQVGGIISGTAEAVGTATSLMSAGTGMTAIGAKSVIGIVEDIIEIFDSVT
jgi:ABC-type transporter Mla subunit MlaD